jgi:hypothetical protein
MSLKMSLSERKMAMSSYLTWIPCKLSIEMFEMYWPLSVIEDMLLLLWR